MKSSTLGVASPAAAPWWSFALVCAVAGLLALYVPVYATAATTIWDSEQNAHAPLVLAVSLWLFWGLREPLAALPSESAGAWGWTLFLAGLLTYVTGRLLGLAVFTFGSQIGVVAGLLLMLKGPAALRLAWFPLFYLVFMIPLPGTLVDAATAPLKQWVSVLVEEVLFRAGYPIARSGVMITIGQYQLLVADACSGLHSMFSLAALGTLFMYLMRRDSRWHNVLMLTSIAPIAFVANVVRVIILVLITYHLGDEAGQGFLHGTAGIVLMLVALLGFFALDAMLWAMLRRWRHTRAAAGAV